MNITASLGAITLGHLICEDHEGFHQLLGWKESDGTFSIFNLGISLHTPALLHSSLSLYESQVPTGGL